MTEQHVIPNDGFAHIVEDYAALGCPCDPQESMRGSMDPANAPDRLVLHRRMDGKPDDVEMVQG